MRTKTLDQYESANQLRGRARAAPRVYQMLICILLVLLFRSCISWLCLSKFQHTRDQVGDGILSCSSMSQNHCVSSPSSRKCKTCPVRLTYSSLQFFVVRSSGAFNGSVLCDSWRFASIPSSVKKASSYYSCCCFTYQPAVCRCGRTSPRH